MWEQRINFELREFFTTKKNNSAVKLHPFKIVNCVISLLDFFSNYRADTSVSLSFLVLDYI